MCHFGAKRRRGRPKGGLDPLGSSDHHEVDAPPPAASCRRLRVSLKSHRARQCSSWRNAWQALAIGLWHSWDDANNRQHTVGSRRWCGFICVSASILHSAHTVAYSEFKYLCLWECCIEYSIEWIVFVLAVYSSTLSFDYFFHLAALIWLAGCAWLLMCWKDENDNLCSLFHYTLRFCFRLRTLKGVFTDLVALEELLLNDNLLLQLSNDWFSNTPK